MRRFLQGLGIGLLVAAIVMGIGTRSAVSSSSNENVIERARELGMVFPREAGDDEVEKLAESSDEPAAEPEDETASGGAVGAGVGGDSDTEVSAAPTESVEPEKSEAPTADPSASPETSGEPEKSPKPSKKPKKSASPAPSGSSDPNATPRHHKNLPQGTRVTFEVRSGLLSSSVAREMYEQGIIADMWAFDHYIENHGLGQSIIAGTYELEVGDSYANIARIITHGG